MRKFSVPSAYREWTVMWRMRRADGLMSHAAIGVRGDGKFVLIWFVNDRPLGYREFSNCTAALDASERMRLQNWTVGWRLTQQYDDTLTAG
jgi:hypothetical protein